MDEAGWQAIGPSSVVAPGGVVPIDVGDLELVAWRSIDGVLTVCDARCPHQWSHLAFEGIVDGDELLCTAHFWRFDRQGHVTELAMNGRRDNKATWRTVREPGAGWDDRGRPDRPRPVRTAPHRG